VLCVVGEINAAFYVNNVTGQQICSGCLAAVLVFAIVFLSCIGFFFICSALLFSSAFMLCE